MRYDTKPIADYDLSSLRVLGSVGNYSKIGNHHNLLLLKVESKEQQIQCEHRNKQIQTLWERLRKM